MKKNKMLAAAILTSTMVCGVALNASAAPITDTTTGTIKFGESEASTTIVKPDTEEEVIIPDDGKIITGDNIHAFVPDFHFGEVKISSGAKKYPVFASNKYKPVDPITGAEGAEAFIPPFIQVVDDRNEATAKWDMTAKLKEVFAENGNTSGHTLANSTIQLNDYKVFNTVYDFTAGETADDHLEGFKKQNTTDNRDGLRLSDTAQVVFKTKDNDTARLSASSLVFEPEYKHDKVYADTDSFNSVQFVKANKDTPKKDTTYKGTVEWTLSSAL